MNTNASPLNRLTFSGNIKPLLDRVCRSYQIGMLNSFSILDVGYEDCNVQLHTEKGDFLAKIFSKSRSPETITRYVDIMQKILENGVSHPRILASGDERILYHDPELNGVCLVLMEYIHGKTFLDMDRAPDEAELRSIIEQAILINRIEYRPAFLFDSWAIPNIEVLFEKTRAFMQPADLPLVELAIRSYLRIPVKTLPSCFVHGDFTKANILKSDTGKIYILDFSVANWYPRIQELAVIAANLMHDASGNTPLRKRIELVAELYHERNPLTSHEHSYLYDYTLAALAMEFMGAYQEKYINGNDTPETDYWLHLGREGLTRELL